MNISDELIKKKEFVLGFRVSIDDVQKLENGEAIEVIIKKKKFVLQTKGDEE